MIPYSQFNVTQGQRYRLANQIDVRYMQTMTVEVFVDADVDAASKANCYLTVHSLPYSTHSLLSVTASHGCQKMRVVISSWVE